MNRLVVFLKRYFHLLLFIILQLVSLVFIYQNLHYPRFVISRFSKASIYPVQKLWSFFSTHFDLRENNEDLLNQNLALLRKLDANFLHLEDSLYSCEGEIAGVKRIYDYTSAHVVYNTLNKRHNYLIIDKGADEGMAVDMAVFSPQGIVGVIQDVSPNFATVISMLHPDMRISARIMPSGQIGTVVWQEPHSETVNLQDIPSHVAVSLGDSVFTSGFSNVFPRDILVGTVLSIGGNGKNSFLDLEIGLSTNFNRLDQVYVVQNLYKNELDSLKMKFKNE